MRQLTAYTRRLDHIVADLADADRLVHGEIELTVRRTDLETLVKRVVEESGIDADHEVRVETERVVVAVDQLRTEQILAGLLRTSGDRTPAEEDHHGAAGGGRRRRRDRGRGPGAVVRRVDEPGRAAVRRGAGGVGHASRAATTAGRRSRSSSPTAPAPNAGRPAAQPHGPNRPMRCTSSSTGSSRAPSPTVPRWWRSCTGSRRRGLSAAQERSAGRRGGAPTAARFTRPTQHERVALSAAAADRDGAELRRRAGASPAQP